MSYSNISDMISELNKDGNNQQKSALALSNTSELEIKNLLKQVDSMIYHKKLRWERQKQDLDNKLIAKEQENHSQKMSLEQKNIEIGQLRKLLENMETTTKEIMKKYEKEMNTLHEQLNKIKSDYVKMQKKYKKSSKNSEDETVTNLTGPSMGSNLNNHKKLASSNSISNISNDVFQIDATNAGSASSTLNPAANNHHQLNNFKLPKIVINHKLKDHMPSNESELNELRAKLDEYKKKETNYYNEKDKLAKVLDHYKRVNQDLVKKVEDMAKLNAIHNDNINEAQSDKLNLDYYKSEMRKRDEYIRNLEALDRADNIELQFYKDEVKKYKKQEIVFKNEMSQIKKDNEDCVKSLAAVENENKKLKNKMQIEESNKAKNDELVKKKIEQENTNRTKELKQLKDEIIRYSNELNEKSQQMKSLSDRFNCLENLYKEKEEQLSKTNQELVMSVAHVEALRLENHFLRQSLMEKKSDEKEIVEMQKKYHTVLELTEKENRKLKNEVVSLSECIESLKSKQNQLISLANKSSNKNGVNGNNNVNIELIENRRSSILRDEYEKQIETLKRQHELSVKRLNNEIEKLYGEKHSLQMELENRVKNSNLVGHKFTNVSSNADSNSLSSGVLSVSNSHGGSVNSEQNNNNLGKKSSKISSEIENNYKFEEPTSSFINRLNNDYLKSISFNRLNVNNAETNVVGFDKSPLKSQKNQPRLSLSSEIQEAEEQRKKNLDNLLDTHIEELRRSSGSQQLNYNHFFNPN